MLDVLYEDNHLIAVNKKAGEIVQADKTGDLPLSEVVKSYIKKKYKKPGKVFLGTIHRLDRPTSGVVLFARTSKSLVRMNIQFKNREVKKTYWAIVNKIPPKSSGILINFLKKDKKKNKSFISTDADGKNAILEYKIIRKLENFYHLEIKPKTGRHHQIRVQLSNIGCIIKGDLKYGSNRSNKNGSIDLLAQKIEFNHPVTNKLIIIKAKPPNDNIWKACSKSDQHL